MGSIQAVNCSHIGNYSLVHALGSFHRTRMVTLSGPGIVRGIRAKRGTKLNKAPDLLGIRVQLEETDVN